MEIEPIARVWVAYGNLQLERTKKHNTAIDDGHDRRAIEGDDTVSVETVATLHRAKTEVDNGHGTELTESRKDGSKLESTL